MSKTTFFIFFSTAARTRIIAANFGLISNYGFRFFESRKIYGVGEEIASAKVWKGEAQELSLGVVSDLYVSIPRGKHDDIEAEIEIPKTIEAPVASGQVIGMLHFKLEGQVIASATLVANQAVGKGSIFDRALDEVLMRFK